MNTLQDTVRALYNGEYACLYPAARWLEYAEGAPRLCSAKEMLQKRQDVQTQIVSSDRISDRLATVSVEYRLDGAWHADVVGAIRTGNWQIVCITSSSMPLRLNNLSDAPSNYQTAAVGEISALVLDYCHQVYLMDADACLTRCFWPQTRMYHPDASEDSFSDVEIQVLYQRWTGTPDPAALGLFEFSRIYDIRLLSSDTAVVKIGCAKLDCFFQDYLTAMIVDEKWRLVNKMTHCIHTGPRI